MEANSILFRCSQLGNIMTEPKAKSETLSETCKNYLIDVFIEKKYKRIKDIQNKYTTKGLMVEEDSITLYSLFSKCFFTKNSERIDNEYITGIPDVVLGKSISNADKIIDCKSSWDIFTFFRNSEKLNKLYYWQMQGYMALTNAQSATVAYCLINTPEQLIFDEKRRLLWKMGVLSDTDPLYIQASELLEKNMKYDDIPIQERIIEIHIERSDADIQRLYNRIIECREYVNKLEETIEVK